MILIFSEESDKSTDLVIDWLLKFKAKFIRVNDISSIEILNFDVKKQNCLIRVNTVDVNISEITAYWYRRGYFAYQKRNLSNDIKLNETLNILLKNELKVSYDFLIHYIENNVKNKIGSYFRSSLNKLYQLDEAISCGLTIPNSYLTKRPFLLANRRYITKSLDTVFLNYDENCFLLNYTNEVEQSLLKVDCELSYLQESIDKDFELRIFYLNKKTFGMAIFSQLNKKTKTDFRRYDDEFPNKNVPFIVPRDLEKKIIKFMQSVNLNTGSLDFIVSKGVFYFLEVNPVGQFGMTSYPCNYNLEKEIATELIK